VCVGDTHLRPDHSLGIHHLHTYTRLRSLDSHAHKQPLQQIATGDTTGEEQQSLLVVGTWIDVCMYVCVCERIMAESESAQEREQKSDTVRDPARESTRESARDRMCVYIYVCVFVCVCVCVCV